MNHGAFMQGGVEALEEELYSTVYNLFQPQNNHLYEEVDGEMSESTSDDDSDDSSDEESDLFDKKRTTGKRLSLTEK